jgi:CheY-like chemotaxis protein
MLEPTEAHWLRSTANELNNLLQIISESVRFIESDSEQSPSAQKYFTMLHASLDRAGQVASNLLQPGPAVSAPAPTPGAGATPVSPPTDESDLKIENPSGSRELIMVVDDEDFVRLLAQRVLTDEGYRVIAAKDGFECLKFYKKLGAKINLVILDFTMPIMDGSEVFEELRGLDPNVSVMLSSGFTEHQKLRWMLSKGLRGFIPKPYSQEKLLLQVRSTLDAIAGNAA